MINKIFALVLCVILLAGCSKPENKEVSSEVVFDKVAAIMNFDENEKMDLSDIKNSQKYGISTDKIKDGYAALNSDGVNADNLVVLRAAEDKEIDGLEEAMLAYINDITTAWENNDTESKKIENRVFKTIDKFILLYVGDEPEKAKEIFDEAVKK